MNSAAAGRNAGKDAWAKCVRATIRLAGVRVMGALTGPRLGAEQMEQEWCEVAAPSGCAWITCAVPMATTRTIPSRDTARANIRRFGTIPPIGYLLRSLMKA